VLLGDTAASLSQVFSAGAGSVGLGPCESEADGAYRCL